MEPDLPPHGLIHAIRHHGCDVSEQLINIQLRFQQFLHFGSAEAGSGRSFLEQVAVVGRLAAVKTHFALYSSRFLDKRYWKSVGQREAHGKSPPGAQSPRRTAPSSLRTLRSK